MKKIIMLLSVLLVLFSFVGCSNENHNELPKGKVKNLEVICDWNSDISRQFSGGEFEYLNETTIKYIDENGKVYYLSTSTLCYLEVDE